MYLRKFKKTEHREHLLRTLKELKTSSNYAKRLLFLDVASQVLEIFSKKFFKLFFFQDLMDISKDSVVNVRIKYISMVPLIYETFALPNDSNLLSKLNDSLKRLTCDLNPEIALHASEIMNKINNGSGGKQNLFRLDAATIGIKREQDRLREEEEKSFLSDWDASSNSILPSASDVKPSRRQSISAGSGLVRSNSTPKANNSAKEATTVVKRTSKKMVSSIDEDISSPLSSAASLAAQLDRLNNSNGKLDSKKDGNNRVQSTETLGSFNNLGRNDKLAAKPTEAKAPKVDKKKEEETRKKMEEESKKILLRPTSSTKSTKEKEEVLGKISTQLKMRGLTSLKKV